MFKTLLIPFSWKTVKQTCVWAYQENNITGKRRVKQIGIGYQPIDRSWILTGQFTKSPTPTNREAE